MLKELRAAAEGQPEGRWLQEVRQDAEIRAAATKTASPKKVGEAAIETQVQKSKRPKSTFEAANEEALHVLQEGAVKERMQELASKLGLSPEESRIEVRRAPNGRCFGLIRFIVRLEWGVREVAATELRFVPKENERIDRGNFGRSANAAAEVLANIRQLKPSEIVAWSNGKLAFLDVVLSQVGASVRVGTKPFLRGA